jgi:hypothetical protein
VQVVLRYVASSLSHIVVRRIKRRVRMSALMRSYLRPYLLAYGVYKFFASSRRRGFRTNLKRGEALHLERR